MTTKLNTPALPTTSTHKLPWLIGGVALLFYWSTLSHWLSLLNLETVARLSGWETSSSQPRPFALLGFTPLRWLPAAWLPLALNVVTAIGATLVLMQLARSVAILRLDVVVADPMRQKVSEQSVFTGAWSWLPPVLASLALGLQTSFWEHATSASGEIFSVLTFAFAFRCVLEFRLATQEKWLYRGAFIYALGLTDNWLLLGYLPVFIGAIIWAKGFGRCLEWRFFWRLAAWGILGLSFYLLIPLAAYLSGAEQSSFWLTLKTYLGGQKHSLSLLRGPAFRLLVLTGLLPFLLLAVRWRSHSVQLADDTHLGVFITKASGHFIHALFLLTALWLALNPVFTPRQNDLGAALLVYNYSWALVAGYGVAYLLLFGQPRSQKPPARWPALAGIFLLVTLPAVLLWKNYGPMHLTSGSALQEFAGQLYDDLPSGNATVLSDEPLPLLLLRAEIGRRDTTNKTPLLIETRALTAPKYHEQMTREYGSRWPASSLAKQINAISSTQMVSLVSHLAAHEPVFYLHPSSGLFYESFVASPHGWLQQLHPRANNPGKTRRDEIQSHQLWQERWQTTLQMRARQFAANREAAARWTGSSFKFLRLPQPVNKTAKTLGGIYSKAINAWAVHLQTSGNNGAAIDWFPRALQFNPDNLAARINLTSAQRRQTGNAERLTLAWLKEIHAPIVAKYQTWPEVIGLNGPVDDPVFLLRSGRMYLHADNPLQAQECFSRSATLAPDWAAPKLWQAQGLITLGDFAAAQKLTAQLLATAPHLPEPAQAQLLQLHVITLQRLGQTNESAAFIEDFAQRHLAGNLVIATAAELCANAGAFESELKWRDELLQRNPKRVDWIVRKGHAELQAKRFEAAIKTLSSALGMAPHNPNARLLRAIAALQAGRLPEAQRDYQELLKLPQQSQRALFGLGGIAWRQQDTNAMIQYYQAFLTNNVAGPQAAIATQRLKDWQDD